MMGFNLTEGDSSVDSAAPKECKTMRKIKEGKVDGG